MRPTILGVAPTTKLHKLVTFDEDMLAVAKLLKLAIWVPTPLAEGKPATARETRGVYRARRKRG